MTRLNCANQGITHLNGRRGRLFMKTFVYFLFAFKRQSVCREELSSSCSVVLFSCSLMSNCDPMDCSTPGFPVLHYLLKLAQTALDVHILKNFPSKSKTHHSLVILIPILHGGLPTLYCHSIWEFFFLFSFCIWEF